MNNTITIVGGGIVGLSIAALLAQHDFSVSLFEAKPFDFSDTALTARVSSIHLASKQLFEYLGVWDDIEKTATPLFEMHVWDHTQNAQLHFDSRDINEIHMGFIVENRVMIKALFEKLKQYQHVQIHSSALPEKKHLAQSALVIGADGAHSWVREQMPITLNVRPYYQKAIIVVVQSEKPHHNSAIQKFLTTGPVALLPLQDAHHTALVWSADDAISDALMQKTEDDFSKALTEALDFKFGKLAIISKRQQFPLMMRHADDYVSERFALAGDAAHTIHPLAGLGVNLGLMDAACLAQTLIDARQNKKNLGDIKTLRRYARWRKADNQLIIAAMRGLKELFAINHPSFNIVRGFGVDTINQCPLIKKSLITLATGLSKDLPSFLQR